MGRPLKLECFDTEPESGASVVKLPESELEEERLQSFDNGYKAGWDDAAQAHNQQQDSISQEFADNLQQLSFTYHEARTAVLCEMEGILRGMVEKILPKTLKTSLGEMIVERLASISDEASETPVQIIVSPENANRFRTLLAGKVAPPLTVQVEPTLGEGQAYLRLGKSEEKLDLDTVLLELSDAVSDYFESTDTVQGACHA
ncbi:hypothetical protein [Tropicimonas marinistellae]|uniref:FliH/SctL family protein n=1 Tax=Tropicimonas marinistellae TaxID=1739787 RepID=UPI0008378CB2|nr:hypothetical protein [Tropicimonas marinistellae]